MIISYLLDGFFENQRQGLPFGVGGLLVTFPRVSGAVEDV